MSEETVNESVMIITIVKHKEKQNYCYFVQEDGKDTAFMSRAFPTFTAAITALRKHLK